MNKTMEFFSIKNRLTYIDQCQGLTSYFEDRETK